MRKRERMSMKKVALLLVAGFSTQLFAAQLSGSLELNMGQPQQRSHVYKEPKQRYGTSQRSSTYKKSMAPSARSRFRRQKDSELQKVTRDVRRTRMALNKKRQEVKRRRQELRRLERELGDYQYDLRFYSDKERCIRNSRNQKSLNRCIREYR